MSELKKVHLVIAANSCSSMSPATNSSNRFLEPSELGVSTTTFYSSELLKVILCEEFPSSILNLTI